MGPFRAGVKIEKPAVCGDLATMANRSDLCAYRPETFETDEWGFRNSKAVWETAVSGAGASVVVFGDSFAFGQGVTQEEKPSAQLARVTGRTVYDAAGKFELAHLRWVVDHLPNKPRWVVYFHLERHFHRAAEAREWDEVIDENNPINKTRIFFDSFKAYNPLKIISARFEKKYFTPGLFPNRYDEGIPHGVLSDGREFLFLKSSVERYGDRRSGQESEEAGYFSQLSASLKERGVKLAVVLIPEKYTVYAPLLAKRPAGIDEKHYFEYLQLELEKRGVTALNLVPSLTETAKEGLPSGTYYYWPDDTHWNARGIEHSARAISRILVD
jgi:hypothetical protein